MAEPRCDGSGEIVGQQIEQRGTADIVQRGGQHDRIDALGLERLAQALPQVFDRQRALLEEFFHQRVIALGDHFHQRFVRGLGGLGQILGNLLDLRLAVAVGRVDMRFHRDQVDHPAKRFLRANRQLQRHDVAAEHARDGLQRAIVIRQLAVHPVDGEGARHVIFGRVVPHFFRDHLHARRGVHQDQHRVGRHQGRARIVQKRAVTRRIQEINFYFFRLPGGRPLGVSQARVNRDFPGDFLFVPVGNRVSLGDLSQPGGHPRGEQQRRHQLGFPRVAVTGNPHIAYGLRSVSFHRSTP